MELHQDLCWPHRQFEQEEILGSFLQGKDGKNGWENLREHKGTFIKDARIARRFLRQFPKCNEFFAFWLVSWYALCETYLGVPGPGKERAAVGEHPKQVRWNTHWNGRQMFAIEREIKGKCHYHG